MAETTFCCRVHRGSSTWGHTGPVPMPALGTRRWGTRGAHLDGLPRQEQRLLPLRQLQADGSVPRGGLGTAVAALCHPAPARKQRDGQSLSPCAAWLTAHGAARAAGHTPQPPAFCPVAQGSPRTPETPRAPSLERSRRDVPAAGRTGSPYPAARGASWAAPPPAPAFAFAPPEKPQQLEHDLHKPRCPRPRDTPSCVSSPPSAGQAHPLGVLG